ncbi:hypothetical protein PG985_016110 [Apiospora marii]|uniref:uncharacterized protein n=1 Tax=Apiospora marii TaxID=335849 RepID=UPI0031316E95
MARFSSANNTTPQGRLLVHRESDIHLDRENRVPLIVQVRQVVLDLNLAHLSLPQRQVLGALVLEVVEEAPEHLLGHVVGPEAVVLRRQGLGAALAQQPGAEHRARGQHGRFLRDPGELVLGKGQVADLAQDLVG